jgi:CheY-specific phosphatase CheX
MHKNEILKKIDSFLAFTSLLPEKNREDYINHLNKVKTEISDLLKKLPSVKSSEPVSESPQAAKINGKSIDKKQYTFINLTKIIIPKLNEKGKNVLQEISTPISLYNSLKMINEKSSILDIYYMHAHKFNNYLEFLSIIQDLSQKKYINFMKTEALDKNNSWVIIGEILEDCNVIDAENINRAIAYQQDGKAKFIGEAMTELRYIGKTPLDDALKLQQWISEIFEKSGDLDKVESSKGNDNIDTEQFIGAYDIMDLIVPVLTGISKDLQQNPNNENSDLLKIIDQKSSLLKIYNKHKEKFADKLDFLSGILKLDLQDLLTYKKNAELENHDAWIRFGTLSMNLDLINENQIDETFIYRHKNINRSIFIGEAMVELNYISREKKNEILKLQRWCNMVLTRISAETSFINAVKEVLEDNFNCATELGTFKRISLNEPLNEEKILITFNIMGKLNGKVYYIFDQSFFDNLTSNILSSDYILDQELVTEICNIITGKSLNRLSKLGMFCETNAPEVNMESKTAITEKNIISAIPLMNQSGRFITGFALNS